VKPIDNSSTKTLIKVKKKFVFQPRHKKNSYIQKTLNFRYTDILLADGIIIKGTVLGYNKPHFLIEFTHNQRNEIGVKHKSEIVQHDLKP
jgi:hypothetical protein